MYGPYHPYPFTCLCTLGLFFTLAFTPIWVRWEPYKAWEQGSDMICLWFYEHPLRMSLCLCLPPPPSHPILTGAQEGAAEWRHPWLSDRLPREQPGQQWAVQHRGDEGHRGQ